MPRIYTSANDPLDFCRNCWLDEDEARRMYGNVGPGTDDRGNCFTYDAEHPDYGVEHYACDCCAERLTELDNYARSWEVNGS